MKLPVGAICFVVLFCAVSRASADAADDFVLAYLQEKRISLGLNAQADEIVAIGHASCSTNLFCGDFALLRDKYHKIASLNARSEILQTLAVTSSAARDAGLRHNGIKGERTVSSACKVFSERILSGWWVVVSHECLDGNKFSVAVAIAWSRSGERRFDELKAGRLVPSPSWKDELLAYIKGQELTSWADVRVFVDSAGFPHLMGIGTASWNGSPPFRDVALRRADMFAQKNLLLGLYGDAAIMEAAGKWRRDVSSESGGDAQQMSFYESLAEVSVSMPAPKGSGSFYVTENTRGQDGLKTIISVFSYEPPAVMDPRERVMGGNGQSITTETQPSGMMIFNPSTGKFEKK